MTESEAIKIFNDLLDMPCEMLIKYDSVISSEKKQALVRLRTAEEFAIKALEKQIPEKVKIEQWIDTKCDCGYEFSKHRGDGYYSIPLENKTKYCPNCGQKLDWDE